MAELLEAPQPREQEAVAQVQIGAGGIEAHLDDQRLSRGVAARELLLQLLGDVEIHRAPGDFLELLLGCCLPQCARAHEGAEP